MAEQLDSQVFHTKVRRSVSVAMAPAHGQSVLTYQPGSKASADLRRIVDAVAGPDFPAPRPAPRSKWF